MITLRSQFQKLNNQTAISQGIQPKNQKESSGMTFNDAKQYALDYMKKHVNNSDDIPQDESLTRLARRYQYFGDLIFEVYATHLRDTHRRFDDWFLIEMLNPKSVQIEDFDTAIEMILECQDSQLFQMAYDYYDAVGHEEFMRDTREWLDQHRDQLLGSSTN